jgi:uncharacterized membrane protein YhiD involved in acid resistance
MYAVQHLDLLASLNTLVGLFTAFALGALIGFERQYRQRTAGLRTNVLVAVGAALFVDIAMRFHAIYGGTPSPLHVVAYVVSGVGFLGAGVIMREEGNIRGINKEVMSALESDLERCRYPVRKLEVHAFGDADIEIEATLTVTSVDGGELDALVRRLASIPAVRQAFWSPSTLE